MEMQNKWKIALHNTPGIAVELATSGFQQLYQLWP